MKNYLLHLSFIYRFRWVFVLPSVLVVNTFYLFATPQQHKNQALIQQKKEEIDRLYKKKCYAKAHAQIEFLLPLLKNRVDRSEFEFYQACCNFHQKQYLVSANQFHLFVKQYPFSPHVEEALFMRGYSFASEEVDIWLDQTVTYDAVRCLEHYLALYPKGVYLDKASHALQDLQARLMQKRFAAAVLYDRLGYHKAAIETLKNFNQDYPDSFLQEKVIGLWTKCYEKLVMSASDVEKKKEVFDRYCLQVQGYRIDDKHSSNVIEKVDKKIEADRSKKVNKGC
ncbi:outer membrane protein assembly factor BamD [Cardinium endosymbiont of Nabis limbatus]|uniref:outer membrane protein assembly factor BamD n=1 Tax=Cardinium endosymbiont of Nabis limbatus TaxID=3066217 RepID=UPI003AF381DD